MRGSMKFVDHQALRGRETGSFSSDTCGVIPSAVPSSFCRRASDRRESSRDARPQEDGPRVIGCVQGARWRTISTSEVARDRRCELGTGRAADKKRAGL